MSLTIWPRPGDIDGPTTTTDNAIVRWDGTNGHAAQNSAAFVDDNGNVYAPNIAPGLVSIATAAATTTLTVASKGVQVFTGVTTQTVTLPVVTTLPQLGFGYYVINNSTGLVTINSSGGNAVKILGANTWCQVTCILLTGTTAASWNASYIGINVATGKVATINNTITLAGTDGTTITLPATTGSVPLIASSISDADTTHSPDGNSVFDALALKQNSLTGTYSLANFTIPASGVASAAMVGAVGVLIFGYMTYTSDNATDQYQTFAVETAPASGVYTTVVIAGEAANATALAETFNVPFSFFVPTGRKWKHTQTGSAAVASISGIVL